VLFFNGISNSNRSFEPGCPVGKPAQELRTVNEKQYLPVNTERLKSYNGNQWHSMKQLTELKLQWQPMALHETANRATYKLQWQPIKKLMAANLLPYVQLSNIINYICI